MKKILCHVQLLNQALNLMISTRTRRITTVIYKQHLSSYYAPLLYAELKANQVESTRPVMNEFQSEFAAYFAMPIIVGQDEIQVKKDPIAFWILESKRFWIKCCS